MSDLDNSPPPDVLADRVGTLPTHDLGSLRAAQIAAVGRSAFEDAHKQHRRGQRWQKQMAFWYGRAIEPTMVAALVIVYLGWAFDAVLSMHR